MARPVKEGLDYFPLDVDIFDDEVIDGISGEFGIKGELAVIKLLCAVYKKGYFIVWNDLMQAQIAKRIQGSKDLANQIVNRLVEWGFFDKALFNSAKVLTSVGIQNRFLEATKRRKRAKPTLYWITEYINGDSNGVNADINPQSKVNKSKSNNKGSSPTASNELINNAPTRESVTEKIAQEFGRGLSPIERSYVNGWFDQGYTPELIECALQEAVLAEAWNLKYMAKVLNGFTERGISTPDEYKQAKTQYEQQKHPEQHEETINGPHIPLFKISQEVGHD